MDLGLIIRRACVFRQSSCAYHRAVEDHAALFHFDFSSWLTSSIHFDLRSSFAAASPPGGNENPARMPVQPFEQRISAEPQLIPRLRTFIAGLCPQFGQRGKSFIVQPHQQMFMAAQLARGALQFLQAGQLRFCAANFT